MLARLYRGSNRLRRLLARPSPSTPPPDLGSLGREIPTSLNPLYMWPAFRSGPPPGTTAEAALLRPLTSRGLWAYLTSRARAHSGVRRVNNTAAERAEAPEGGSSHVVGSGSGIPRLGLPSRRHDTGARTQHVTAAATGAIYGVRYAVTQAAPQQLATVAVPYPVAPSSSLPAAVRTPWRPQLAGPSPSSSPAQAAAQPSVASVPAPLAAPHAAPTLWLEGTVQKVQFRCSNTAYTVLRVQVTTTAELEAEAVASGAGALFAIKPRGRSGGGSSSAAARKASRVIDGAAEGTSTSSPVAQQAQQQVLHRPRKVLVTVVGSLPAVAVGQCLRFAGGWGEHRQYGWQFKASDIQELSLQSDTDLVAYLAGGVIPGVGPVIAKRLVDKWGVDIEKVLDSPYAVERLRQCSSIGQKTAERIKAGWDLNRGTREGVIFLKEHGIPIPLAQRVADQWGPGTRAAVTRDPYLALSGLGLPFIKVDLLAAKVGAAPDLVSRAGLALAEVLTSAAADEGHAFLPWEQLERRAGKLLRDVGEHHGHPWPHPELLHLAAQHLHLSGSVLVAEPPPPTPDAAGGPTLDGAAEEAAVTAAAADRTSVLQVDLSEAAAPAGAQQQQQPRVHPSFGSSEELRGYLRERITGLTEALAQSMVDTHGPSILPCLDSPPDQAHAQLRLCPKIGPVTAKKFKTRWDASFGEDTRGGAGVAGLRLGDLAASPPAVGWWWGPATRCYPPMLHKAEQVVAEVALQKANLYKQPGEGVLRRIRKWIEQSQQSNELDLSEGQRTAIEVASNAPIMVLTGGPGCGKTSTVQTIVKLWGAQGKLVKICAPTGRAAQRMGVIQGIEPCTIHRLLRYTPRRASDGSLAQTSDAASEEATLGEGGSFEYNRDNPLPAKAVLVDEASMLSLPLAAALLGALGPKCQLVLVGDVDQLPPVGPGSVLRSLIESRLVPVVDLREIFRQAAESSIVTSAVAVRRGELPVLCPVQPTPEGLQAAPSDALWVQAASSEDVPNAVRQTVWALTQTSKFAGAEHVQVITPMRKGPAGTSTLNPLLQQLLNPPHPSRRELHRHPGAHAAAGPDGSGSSGPWHGEAAGSRVLRMGDRVIQLINNYDKDIFNGDQGLIVDALPAERKLTVRFPKAPTADNPAPYLDVTYQGQELSQLELAYAITVHKAQGGESKHVVLVLSHHHNRMLSRRLLYTGLTRAKEQLIVVSPGGKMSPLERAVQHAEHGSRLSSLSERLEAGGGDRGLARHEPREFNNESEVLTLHTHPPAAEQAQQAEQQQQDEGLAQQGGGLEDAVGCNLASLPAAAAAEAAPMRGGSRRGRHPKAAGGEAEAAPKPVRKPRAVKAASVELPEGLPPLVLQNARFLQQQGVLSAELRGLLPQLQGSPDSDLSSSLPALVLLLEERLQQRVDVPLLVRHAPLALFSSPQQVGELLNGGGQASAAVAAEAAAGGAEQEGRPGSGSAGGPGAGALASQLSALEQIVVQLQRQQRHRRLCA